MGRKLTSTQLPRCPALAPSPTLLTRNVSAVVHRSLIQPSVLTCLCFILEGPRTDLDFDHTDRVYSVRPSQRICITFRHADVVEQSLLDERGQRACYVLNRDSPVDTGALEQVDALEPSECSIRGCDAPAEVLWSATITLGETGPPARSGQDETYDEENAICFSRVPPLTDRKVRSA